MIKNSRATILFFLLSICSFVFSYGQIPEAAPKKNGSYVQKIKRQILVEGTCTNGFKTGTWKYYDAAGYKSREEDFDGGGFLLRSRIYQYNYDDGTGEEFTSVNGKYAGPYRQFEGGKIIGNVRIQGFYEDGQKDSTWKFYRRISASNNLWKTENWKKGKLKEQKTYYVSGTPFSIRTYDENGVANPIYLDSAGSVLVMQPIAKDTTKATDTTKAFVLKEKMPTLSEGMDLNQFLMMNIHYPTIAKTNGIHGRVWVDFTVNKYGEMEDIKIKNHVEGHESIEKEAIRVFEMMPPWHPGELNGRKVRVTISQSVNFILQ